MKRDFLFSIILIISLCFVSTNNGAEILLKSRHFTPERGISSELKAKIEAISGKAHVFIQLDHKPTIEDINQLEMKGVKLLSYIPKDAWIASIPTNKINEITAISYVRSISEILPEDKISPHIISGNIFEQTVKDGKTAFIIQFFRDVSSIKIEETITRHNCEIAGWIPSLKCCCGCYAGL